MPDAQSALRRLNEALRARNPSAQSALTNLPGRTNGAPPCARISSIEPMPSHWFRSAALLDVRGLRVAAPNAPMLVGGISLSITRGEVIGLVGDAASGAVQIAQCIAGVLQPPASIRSGSILFNGIELVGLAPRGRDQLRRTIAYLPRDPLGSLDPSVTVGAQLTAALRSILGVSKAAASKRSLHLLRKAGVTLPDCTLMAYPRELSATTAQRIHIAQALAGRPELIVADNPTEALDALGGATILALLRTLQSAHNLTMIVATDSVSLAAQNCHRVAILRGGAIVEYASVTELIDSPKHPFTRKLLHAAAANDGPHLPAL